jgi:hypothetical protein
MSIKDKDGPNLVKLPDNTILSRADLPAKDTRRWVVSRKFTVVRAVVYGLISLDDALETYAISEEEFFPGSIWLHSMGKRVCAPHIHNYIYNLNEKQQFVTNGKAGLTFSPHSDEIIEQIGVKDACSIGRR